MRDLDIRSELIANALREPLQETLLRDSKKKTLSYFNTIIQDERLYALGFCPEGGGTLLATKTFPVDIRCDDLARFEVPAERVLDGGQGYLHVSVRPVEQEGKSFGKLVLAHDMSFIQRRGKETKQYVFVFFVALGIVMSLMTVIIA